MSDSQTPSPAFPHIFGTSTAFVVGRFDHVAALSFDEASCRLASCAVSIPTPRRENCRIRSILNSERTGPGTPLVLAVSEYAPKSSNEPTSVSIYEYSNEDAGFRHTVDFAGAHRGGIFGLAELGTRGCSPRILSGDKSSLLVIWNRETGQEITRLPDSPSKTYDILEYRASELYVVGGLNFLGIYDVEKLQLRWSVGPDLLGEDGTVVGLCKGIHEASFFSCKKNGTVRMWDMRMKVSPVIEIPDGFNTYDLTYCSDLSTLYAGCERDVLACDVRMLVGSQSVEYRRARVSEGIVTGIQLFDRRDRFVAVSDCAADNVCVFRSDLKVLCRTSLGETSDTDSRAGCFSCCVVSPLGGVAAGSSLSPAEEPDVLLELRKSLEEKDSHLQRLQLQLLRKESEKDAVLSQLEEKKQLLAEKERQIGEKCEELKEKDDEMSKFRMGEIAKMRRWELVVKSMIKEAKSELVEMFGGTGARLLNANDSMDSECEETEGTNLTVAPGDETPNVREAQTRAEASSDSEMDSETPSHAGLSMPVESINAENVFDADQRAVVSEIPSPETAVTDERPEKATREFPSETELGSLFRILRVEVAKGIELLSSRLSSTERRESDLRGRVTQMVSLIESKHTEITELRRSISSRDSELLGLQREKVQSVSMIVGQKAMIGRLQAETTRLSRELEMKESMITHLKSEKERLRSEKSSSSEAQISEIQLNRAAGSPRTPRRIQYKPERRRPRIRKNAFRLSCLYAQDCLKFVEDSMGFRDSPLLDHQSDTCYCFDCRASRGQRNLEVVDSGRYALPLDWVKFSLPVTAVQHEQGVLGWDVAFHGTSPSAAAEILRHGLTLLQSGDHLPDGTQLSVVEGHIGDGGLIFVSPSIKYCSQVVYCEPKEFEEAEYQVAFQVRIKPGSYEVQPETVLEPWQKDYVLDRHFPNSELEWKTKRRCVIVITGLMVRKFWVDGV